MGLKSEAIASPRLDGLWKSDVLGLLVRVSIRDAHRSGILNHHHLDVLRGDPGFVGDSLRLTSVMPKRKYTLRIGEHTRLCGNRFEVECWTSWFTPTQAESINAAAR